MKYFRRFLPFLILAMLYNAGCRNKDSGNNPCDDLLNESPPFTVFLKVTDKGTGENLLINGSLKETDIAFVEKATNTDLKNWKVVNTGSTSSPYYGTIQLVLFDETEGQKNYLIQLGSSNRATLQYTVTRKQTDDPCKPIAYPISNVKLTDHPFSYMTVQGKELTNFLVLEL